MQVTARDERIFEWLRVVRVADSEALRWVLAAVDGRDRPVTLRRAQQWIARGVEGGVIERARPIFREGSVVWLSKEISGRGAPDLLRQTLRHEITVAALSARFLAAGYTWERDPERRQKGRKIADGIARRGERVERVEVELTTKERARYAGIMQNHVRWLTQGVDRVVYVGTPVVVRDVAEEADKHLHPALRDRLVTVPALDRLGHIVGSVDALWDPAGHLRGQAQTAGRFEEEPVRPVDIPPVLTLPVWGGRD